MRWRARPESNRQPPAVPAGVLPKAPLARMELGTSHRPCMPGLWGRAPQILGCVPGRTHAVLSKAASGGNGMPRIKPRGSEASGLPSRLGHHVPKFVLVFFQPACHEGCPDRIPHFLGYRGNFSIMFPVSRNYDGHIDVLSPCVVVWFGYCVEHCPK